MTDHVHAVGDGGEVKIHIKPSQTADTRTCDWSKVSKEQLLKSSVQHIGDMAQAMALFASMLQQAGLRHDHDKLSAIPADVNLIDVLEYIADCVMAGLARSGSVYDVTLPSELLQRAFSNTVEHLKAAVVVDRD